MRRSEISLFTSKEQTLLVATESARLEGLSEDELVDLLGRVRRGRNKYSDLHRRQGAGAVRTAGRRQAAQSSNERTRRKAEIFEDAVSRVARYVSKAARASANELKEQRLADARRSHRSHTSTAKAPSKQARPTGARAAKNSTKVVSPQRVGATSAANKRNQSAKDQRTAKSRR